MLLNVMAHRLQSVSVIKVLPRSVSSYAGTLRLITPGARVGADSPGLAQSLAPPRIPHPLPGPHGQGNVVHLLSDTLTKLAQGTCATTDPTPYN